MHLKEFALNSRFKSLRNAAYKRLDPGQTFNPGAGATRVLMAGDMSFDPEFRYPPGVYRKGYSEPLLQKFKRVTKKRLSPLLFSPNLYMAGGNRDFGAIRHKTLHKGVLPGSPKYAYCTKNEVGADGDFLFPFRKVAPFLKTKDIVFANLENPLTRSKRSHGFFLGNPGYAGALKEAGLSIVSIANNHIFDGGERGFLDTLEHLRATGIPFTGGDSGLAPAREGRVIRANGTSILFLAYTRYCNSNFASVADSYPGILPLDMDMILEDLESARGKADFIFVSLHWGFENQPNVHPLQIEMAHRIIDAGADCIIGHHSHIPHGIEIYKERPIIYSPGNFIFAYYMEGWQDNFLAEAVIEGKKIKGILVHPVSGMRNELFQPEILKGERADSLLKEIKIKSARFKTPFAVEDGAGYVRIG
jgi:poly-gamma-glutamate capsule biosynthesis protein CapA/YwtB (metallophosphatase superfamily)